MSASDSPVPPVGDTNRLDDEDRNLEEKHKEEEEEAEGAVRPKKQETENMHVTQNVTSCTKYLRELHHLMHYNLKSMC